MNRPAPADPAELLTRCHHDPSVRWVSNPTPAPGETVTVTVLVPGASDVSEVRLRTMHDGEARWWEGVARPVTGGTEWDLELRCHNATTNYRFWLDGDDGARWLTGLGEVWHDPLDTHDFRLVTTGRTPTWVPETVWYQIFPDRFATSGRHRHTFPEWADPADWSDPVVTGPPAMTQLYGGDLDGIVEHLDHLVELGVGGIYLNPVFPGRSNHRYDAATFDEVDPVLGGDEALVRLREATRARGLRLMTDITPNHTGDGHEWFRAAQADADSVEAGFFHFTDHPDEYESWLGVRSLPKLDHRDPELGPRLIDGPASVIGRFLHEPFDMDGWRVDVANMTGRYGLIDENEQVRNRIRATVEGAGDDKWLVGEHFFDGTRDLDGQGWHGVMNYAGVARPIVSWLGEFSTLAAMMPGPGQDPRDGVQVAAAMDDVRGALPWQVVLGSMALLGSHDTARWQTMARSPELARVGFAFMVCLPGTPCFLYGDEVGLTGTDAEQARRTMPWDPDGWDHDLLGFHREVLGLLRSTPALAHGGFRWAEIAPDALTFLRETDDDRILVRVSRAAAETILPLAGLVASGATPLLLTGDAAVDVVDESVVLSAPGPSVTVVRLA